MSKSALIAVGFIVLILSSGWIWAFPEANLFYLASVVVHIGLGFSLVILLWLAREKVFNDLLSTGRIALVNISVAAVLGLTLCIVGATLPNRSILITHIVFGFIGAVLITAWAWKKHPIFARYLCVALVLALGLPVLSSVRLEWFPRAHDRIINPVNAPLSMDHEGGGKGSPFFPSSSVTNTGEPIPSDFFMDSKVCGDCHKDIYDQWSSSMHHFSSFNNQFYRKSVEYMQETAGVEASKWCAGCHDHAMFFNGRFDTPVKDQIDTPEAQAGLGCMSCHSITHVPDTMGNGGFTMTYPPLHDLGANDNWLIRSLHNYVVNTAPAAHRNAFMKPFMRLDRSEFCSSCHKVHLDLPVNNYRWLRGFNEYDSWQASGVSGFGARSFYYPEQPSDCNDCHMPLVASDDPGNVDGFVHSHRFPAANTAVPYVNRDHKQLAVVKDFLQDNIVSVDIFAISPVVEDQSSIAMLRRTDASPMLATGFAVGEEAANNVQTSVLREIGQVSAPIDQTAVAVTPGSKIKIDVVVRTHKVGHFFPGGTVDAFDVWLELKAVDATGRIIFWSGKVEDNGRGAVEPGAHFYRSFLLDQHGNPINKRNAFHARSLLYAQLIPPGAADTAHFRMTIPTDARSPIRLTAKVNHRKFSHYYTQFAYSGQPDSNNEAKFGKDFDDRQFTFISKNIPGNVAGAIKDHIPTLPIITLAKNEVEISVEKRKTEWVTKATRDNYERWNDYGIGLLRQGDLRGAEHAFQKVIEGSPDFPDGWLNVARALLQEGQTVKAKSFIEQALNLNKNLGRSHFFYAKVQRAEGDYDGALASLSEVESGYPRDRVVLNEIAQILFRKRQYEKALEILDRVARIDPEDLQMHYTRMLCYKGLGDSKNATREEMLFRRFKADESSQAITARIRRLSMEDNNERQPIHEHVSVELPRKKIKQSKINARLPVTGTL